MVDVADVDLAAGDVWLGALNLRVAAKAKVHVALDEQLGIDGAVGRVANRAAFPQGLVLKDKRPRLFAMALGAGFVHARHRQPARRLEDVAAMGVMALGAVHVLLEDRVMLGQMKFGFDGAMTLETRRRILARIDNELSLPAPTGGVQAAGTVAGFAAGLARGTGIFQADTSVGAAPKDPRDVGVAFSARFVPDERRAGNLGRGGQTDRNRGAGI